MPTSVNGQDMKEWIAKNLVKSFGGENGMGMQVAGEEQEVTAGSIELTENGESRVLYTCGPKERIAHFIRNKDCVSVYQLEHDHTKSEKVLGISVLMGFLEKRSALMYGGNFNNSVKRFGCPLRMSIVPCSCKQIHDRIWQHVERILVDDHEYSRENRPYKVYVTGAMGTTWDLELPDEDKPVESVANFWDMSYQNKRNLLILWTPELYANAVDKDELGRFDVDPSIADGEKNAKKRIDLSDCFQKFVEVEKLGNNDLWYCSRCKDGKQVKNFF